MLHPCLPHRPSLPPSPQQLALPVAGEAPALLPPSEATGMGLRPRSIWHTLSPLQREGARRAFLRVATELLREEGADDQRG